MKCVVDRKPLLAALRTVSRIIGKRPGSDQPGSRGVSMEVSGNTLTLATDYLDISAQVRVQVEGISDGVCVVLDARRVTKIVGVMGPGALTIAGKGDKAIITAGRSLFRVLLLAEEEDQQIPEVAAEAVVLDAAELRRGLRQVLPAAGDDPVRPTLTGVLMANAGGRLRLVATDSYRLAICDLPGASVLAEDQQVLVPARALGELVRVLGGVDHVSMRLDEARVSFEAGAVRITTRRFHEGEYPNYGKCLPTGTPHRLVVRRGELLSALRRVRVAVVGYSPVRLAIGPDRIRLTVVTVGEVVEAQEGMSAKYEGPAWGVALNPQFLIDGLKAMPGDEVAVDVQTSKPVVIRSTESTDFTYLLMPVRVS